MRCYFCDSPEVIGRNRAGLALCQECNDLLGATIALFEEVTQEAGTRTTEPTADGKGDYNGTNRR
jgi:hypothetical protein